MAPNVFVTGATGYIAGDALYVIHNEHPDWNYTCLVRSPEKAKAVEEALPGVKTVIGDLDASDLLEREAAKADIVIHAADASDHEGAANAIAKGIRSGHSKEKPGYWIHTGGTGILTYFDSKDNFAGLGSWSDKQFNDLDGVEELTHLPDEAFHRNVDKIALAAGANPESGVRTVIVCPPTIYGKGRGPVSQRGRQVYEMAKLILTKKYIPIIGEGKARWNNVHVHDLSEVYRLLVNKAAALDSSPELWGPKGYILTENGEHVWSDLAKLMGKTVSSSEGIADLKEGPLDKDAALEQAGFEAVSWGLNSRAKAGRASKFLGWKPVQPSLEEEVPNIIRQERERLQPASYTRFAGASSTPR